MTWNASLPANSTKIRDYPTVLTNNFVAIEQGDSSLNQWAINLIDRNVIPSAPPVDPTAITDNITLYTKPDASGRRELHYIDADATPNVIQLTQGVPILATTGETFLGGGIGIKWGVRNGTNGITVNYAMEGLTPFNTATLNVQLTVIRTGISSSSASVVDLSLTASGFDFNQGTSPRDVYWVAIGY